MSEKKREMERRTMRVPELRVVEQDGRTLIRGYAAMFEVRSDDLGGFVEEIDPHAFDRTIGEADVRSLWQHDSNFVLGRNMSGTLRLFIDETGLGYEVEPPDTQWARDALVTMRRGDVTQSSFQFRVPDAEGSEWTQKGDLLVRRLLDVDLFEVSPVTFPAYPQTSAQVRARIENMIKRMADGGGQVPGPEDVDIEEAGAAGRARLDVLRKKLDLAEF